MTSTLLPSQRTAVSSLLVHFGSISGGRFLSPNFRWETLAWGWLQEDARKAGKPCQLFAVAMANKWRIEAACLKRSGSSAGEPCNRGTQFSAGARVDNPALIMERATRHDWYEGSNSYRDAAHGVLRRAVSRRSSAFESGDAGRQGSGGRQRGSGQRHPVWPVLAEPVAEPRCPDAATGGTDRLRPAARRPRTAGGLRWRAGKQDRAGAGEGQFRRGQDRCRGHAARRGHRIL